MEIRRLYSKELSAGLKLIWETFLEFEAPDYSQEGINSFHDFITNPDCLVSLEFIGAFQEGQLKGVIAAKDDRRHICCFFPSARGSAECSGTASKKEIKTTLLPSIRLPMLSHFITSWVLWTQIQNRLPTVSAIRRWNTELSEKQLLRQDKRGSCFFTSQPALILSPVRHKTPGRRIPAGFCDRDQSYRRVKFLCLRAGSKADMYFPNVPTPHPPVRRFQH